MSMPKQGSMRKVLLTFEEVLRNDEEILRLLYYPPFDKNKNPQDPLDENLPNILDMEGAKKYEIIEDRIKVIQKESELTDAQICRIYLYAGKRKPTFSNTHLAYQEIVFDVFVHEDFETDFRLAWIADRLNELIVRERIAGLGKVDFQQSDPFQAPREYVRMRHIYRISVDKKWQ